MRVEVEGTGRPGEWGDMDQPNPEIRDDSYLNNVGGTNSEQPREEANPADKACPPPPPRLKAAQSRASVRVLHLEREKNGAINNLILKLREIELLLCFLNTFYPLSMTALDVSNFLLT